MVEAALLPQKAHQEGDRQPVDHRRVVDEFRHALPIAVEGARPCILDRSER